MSARVQRIAGFPWLLLFTYFREQNEELCASVRLYRVLGQFAAFLGVLGGVGSWLAAHRLQGLAMMVGGGAAFVLSFMPRFRELCGLRCPRCARLSGQAANFQGDVVKCKSCGETWIP